MSITEILTYAGQIEKLGVVGLLAVFCLMLGWALYKLRQELTRTYMQRDKARLALVKCKAALDAHDIKIDLTDVAELISDGAE